MKRALMLLLAVPLAGCMVDEEVALTPDEQGRLAAAIGDRTERGVLHCVNLRDLGNNRSIGRNAILFDGPGDRIYVNRTRGSCPSLEFGRALRTRTSAPQLCSGDIALVFDPVSGIEHGGCGLGEFAVYER